ncbi:dihydropyrimidinase-like [Quercus lobata]|uniref:dihydropyrimidinase-like n=1 Tax=Quercus lobata TaxID=97700 RepID=UPI0012491351|nr:dihydropyrimidinase-like [Quercus lobata]
MNKIYISLIQNFAYFVKQGADPWQRVIREPGVSGLSLDESGVWDPDFVTAAKFVMSPPISASGHDKALQAALSTGILQVPTNHNRWDRKDT